MEQSDSDFNMHMFEIYVCVYILLHSLQATVCKQNVMK